MRGDEQKVEIRFQLFDNCGMDPTIRKREVAGRHVRSIIVDLVDSLDISRTEKFRSEKVSRNIEGSMVNVRNNFACSH